MKKLNKDTAWHDDTRDVLVAYSFLFSHVDSLHVGQHGRTSRPCSLQDVGQRLVLIFIQLQELSGELSGWL
jgi:hypothetical protein